ncbi:MAG: thiamine pyrophosphate-dependent enzyme, partial [Pseudomonadota bacterium]
LVLVGGGGWDRDAGGRAALDALTRALGTAEVPLAVTFRCQDLVDNTAPAYAGDAGVGMTPAMKRLVGEAEVIVAINTRFGETSTDGYTLLQVPEPRQRLIHVHPSDGEIGKVYQAHAAHHAGPAAFAAALAEALPAVPEGGSAAARRAWAAEARAGYRAVFDLPAQPEGLDMGAVMAVLRARLPADAILTNGAGNFAIWPSKLFVFGPDHRLLAPQAGSMGYGVPAAIAAKLRYPDRTVVCFAGDGDVQMSLSELGTALQARAQPVILVLNNGSYGTIRMHQEREYPGRISATRIENPDYVTLGHAYGMLAERVAETEAFAPALERALASPTGALLELIVPTEAITPRQSLSAIRAAAEAALARGGEPA